MMPNDDPYELAARGVASDPYEEAARGSGADEWASANAIEPTYAQNQETRKVKTEAQKKKPLLQRIYENAMDKEQARSQEDLPTRFKKAIGNLGLGPVSQTAAMINDVTSPIREEAGLPEWAGLPAPSVASFAKGYASIPVGISRRLYSTFMPGSAESRAAGDMASFIQRESENYAPSTVGEIGGQGLFTAGIPGGPVLDKANKVGRAALGAAKGAGYGLSDPGWNTPDEQEYRSQAIPSALAGGALGVGAEFAPEIGSAARSASERLGDPAKRMKELLASIGGKPKDVFKSELGAEKIARIRALDAEFEAALANGGEQRPDVSPIVQKIDENLSRLNPQIEQDSALIGRLEGMKQRLLSGGPAPTGASRYEQLIAQAKAGSKEAPDTSIAGLSSWRRLVGQRQQAAFDTAGNAVQVTPSREHGEAIRSIKNAIDESIANENPEVAARLAAARENWKTQMSPFIPDALGQNPVERMMLTSTPDTELNALIGTKSGDAAERLMGASSPKAREAFQAAILEDAMKFHKKDGPIGMVRSLTDEHGELIPAAAHAFQGADRAMLEGAIKIASIADKLGKGTNIAAGMLASTIPGTALGAGVGSPAGGMGMLAGGWAGRKWLPNWSAGGWEKLIRNKGTRSMLVLLGKLPEDSPEAQKIATSLLANPAWQE